MSGIIAGDGVTGELNWDDLRIVEVLAARGRFAHAAAELGVDETTVARRLRRLERALSMALFEARDGGWVPSAAGRSVLDHIGDMRRHVGAIATLGRESGQVAGRVRVATTPLLASRLLAPRLGALLARHPGLEIDLATSTGNVDFGRWEADFAIRLSRPERGRFIISKLGSARLLLVGPSEPARAEAAVVCAFPEALSALPEMQALRRLGLDRKARFFSDDLAVVRALVCAGQARAILTDYVCRDLMDEPGLTITPLPEQREVWLLMQPHLKTSPAAQAVLAWIRSVFEAAP